MGVKQPLGALFSLAALPRDRRFTAAGAVVGIEPEAILRQRNPVNAEKPFDGLVPPFKTPAAIVAEKLNQFPVKILV